MELLARIGDERSVEVGILMIIEDGETRTYITVGEEDDESIITPLRFRDNSVLIHYHLGGDNRRSPHIFPSQNPSRLKDVEIKHINDGGAWCIMTNSGLTVPIGIQPLRNTKLTISDTRPTDGIWEIHTGDRTGFTYDSATEQYNTGLTFPQKEAILIASYSQVLDATVFTAPAWGEMRAFNKLNPNLPEIISMRTYFAHINWQHLQELGETLGGISGLIFGDGIASLLTDITRITGFSFDTDVQTKSNVLELINAELFSGSG